MESVRTNIRIAENNFRHEEYEQENFLSHTYQNYIRYSESLFSSFFTGQNSEVQRTIIHNNFGLKDEDITSWGERASRYNITPEVFAFFLHVAMFSASEGFAAVEADIEENKETLAQLLKKEIKKREKLEKELDSIPKSYKKSKSKKSKSKSKRKISKSQLDSSNNSESEYTDYDTIPFQPNVEANSDDYMDDDRDLDINRPISKTYVTQDRTIAESSGTQPIIDEITPITNTSLIVDITPQPQQVIQQKTTVTNSTKSLNKNKKSNKNLVQNVITGHTPTDEDTSRVRDILVYDVPVFWTPEEILKQLTLWGKTISLQTKPQRKYQTLRLKIELSTFRLAQFEVNEHPVWTTDLGGIPVRWFPSRWTLKERKQREKFQATLHKIPDSMTLATLWKDQRPHSFLSAIKGLKSFKIVQTARGERKLIGYFEKWVDMRNALDNKLTWDEQILSWNRHTPPTQTTRSRGSDANKNQNRTSRSQQTEKTQSNSKNSKKKPEETKSKKPEEQKKKKKDKSRSRSKSKVLAEILDLLRKLV